MIHLLEEKTHLNARPWIIVNGDCKHGQYSFHVNASVLNCFKVSQQAHQHTFLLRLSASHTHNSSSITVTASSSYSSSVPVFQAINHIHTFVFNLDVVGTKTALLRNTWHKRPQPKMILTVTNRNLWKQCSTN